MSRKTIAVFIFMCCILAIILAAFLANRYRIYPSVFGNTIDTAPGIEFSARLDQSDGSRRLVCVIRNDSGKKINFGEEFYLERERNGEWFEVNDKTGRRADEKAWNAVARTVPAGGEKELIISLDGFRPLTDGRYRVIKKISLGENGVPNEIIAAYFAVE